MLKASCVWQSQFQLDRLASLEFRTDLPVAKAEPVSNGGNISLVKYLRTGVESLQEVLNNLSKDPGSQEIIYSSLTRKRSNSEIEQPGLPNTLGTKACRAEVAAKSGQEINSPQRDCK
ncbi:hypothetical protein TURU_098391 [Turdus rufiventris]|nr:hypothetical protein TURU_098391 [Turdus rufiventris]